MKTVRCVCKLFKLWNNNNKKGSNIEQRCTALSMAMVTTTKNYNNKNNEHIEEGEGEEAATAPHQPMLISNYASNPSEYFE